MRLFGPRRRLVALAAVNGLIVAHLYVYYKLGNRSIGAVDFHGIASVFTAGTIGAGTVFVVLALVATLLLGRVFCGWGCHFALFQDLLFRLLTRLGLSPPFRRSRLEHVLPPILLFFTLCFPIIAWLQRNGLPSSVRTDLGYPEVWRLLPGLKGVALILLFDVVILTVLFGSRAFCRFLCPYGYVLKWIHAIAPMRVVLRGSCDDCGSCARVCPTAVPIKYELEHFGVIRDLNCVNCGDCVAACPSGALAMKPTRLAYQRGYRDIVAAARQPLWAEAILLVTAVAGLVLYRGEEYGDFLAAAIGLTAGASLVVSVQPSRFVSARWFRLTSKRTLRWVAALVAFYVLVGLVGQGIGHAFLRRGMESYQLANYAELSRTVERGSRVSRGFKPFTFYLDDFSARLRRETEPVFVRAGELVEQGSWEDAEHCYRTVLTSEPERAQAWGDLGTSLYMQNRFDEAALCYLRVLDTDPNDLIALYHLAMTKIHQRQLETATDIVEKILSIDSDGTCYQLIRENPEFVILERVQRYRQAMALYRVLNVSGPEEVLR